MSQIDPPMPVVPDSKPTSWVLGLGYSGLIPFVSLGAAVWLSAGAIQLQLQFALLAYGTCILSFLGAIHWGLAVREPGRPVTWMLAWGVLPSLLAWVALLVGAAAGLWLLLASLWMCFAVDRNTYPRFGLRAWLLMRLTLTSVASLSCAAAALAPLQ